MHIKELSIAEFNAFASSCPLGSYHQSSNYALFMAENNFEYDFLGYVDELGVIKAAALILIKKINISYKYGYSPKGFLLDYFDSNLLAAFTTDLRKYYAKKLVFIKINPEIAIGEINKYSKIANYNQNIIIRDFLKNFSSFRLIVIPIYCMNSIFNHPRPDVIIFVVGQEQPFHQIYGIFLLS